MTLIKQQGFKPGEYFEMEVLPREVIEEIIEELSPAEIYKEALKMHNYHLNTSAEIDLRNGNICYHQLRDNERLHPAEDWYVTLVELNAGMDPTPDIINDYWTFSMLESYNMRFTDEQINVSSKYTVMHYWDKILRDYRYQVPEEYFDMDETDEDNFNITIPVLKNLNIIDRSFMDDIENRFIVDFWDYLQMNDGYMKFEREYIDDYPFDHIEFDDYGYGLDRFYVNEVNE